jgi:hypothetical protein
LPFVSYFDIIFYKVAYYYLIITNTELKMSPSIYKSRNPELYERCSRMYDELASSKVAYAEFFNQNQGNLSELGALGFDGGWKTSTDPWYQFLVEPRIVNLEGREYPSAIVSALMGFSIHRWWIEEKKVERSFPLIGRVLSRAIERRMEDVYLGIPEEPENHEPLCRLVVPDTKVYPVFRDKLREIISLAKKGEQ